MTDVIDQLRLPEDHVRASRSGFHLCVLPDYAAFMKLLTAGLFRSGEYIFRGQPGPDMNLTPSLSRLVSHLAIDERKRIRDEHRLNFIKFARGRIHDPLANPLATHMKREDLGLNENESDEMIWALGQHYGLRTPLLDWTTKALMALFFAFDGGGAASRTRRFRALYALNTTLVDELNKATNAINEATPLTGVDKGKNADFPTLSIVPATRWHNPRLTAQHGVFTYCTRDMTVEDWVMYTVRLTKRSNMVPVLIKFLIEEGDPRDCLRYLDDVAGINMHALFPDIGGSAQYCARLVEGLIKTDGPSDRTQEGAAVPVPVSPFGLWLRGLKEGDAVTLETLNGKPDEYTLVSHLNSSTGWSLILRDRGDGANRYFVKVPLSDGASDIPSVENHVRGENSLLSRLKGIQGVPSDAKVVFVKAHLGNDDMQPHLHPALMNGFIEGLRLDQMEFGDTQEPEESAEMVRWLIQFALRLAEILKSIHGQQIVHLSILPRYIVFKDYRSRGSILPPCEASHLVGFGYARSWAAPGSLRLPAKEDMRFRAPEARCDRYDLGGSSFHSDVYSLGALLYSIAAEKGEPGRGDSEAIMRSTVWKKWVGERDFLKSVLCKCVNEMPDDRYANTEQMTYDLETALKIEERREERSAKKPVDYRDRKLHEILELDSPSGEKTGGRDTLIDFVCSIFVRLPVNSIYRTRTHARYWTARNLGVYGRLFALNRDLLSMGKANVHRLFLTSDTFLQMPHEEQEVFMRHASVNELGGIIASTKVQFLAEPAKVFNFERFSEHVAVVDYEGQYLGISFISRGNVTNSYDRVRLGGEIVKARWRTLGTVEGRLWSSEFEADFNRDECLSIGKFIAGDNEGKLLPIKQLLGKRR